MKHMPSIAFIGSENVLFVCNKTVSYSFETFVALFNTTSEQQGIILRL